MSNAYDRKHRLLDSWWNVSYSHSLHHFPSSQSPCPHPLQRSQQWTYYSFMSGLSCCITYLYLTSLQQHTTTQHSSLPNTPITLPHPDAQEPVPSQSSQDKQDSTRSSFTFDVSPPHCLTPISPPQTTLPNNSSYPSTNLSLNNLQFPRSFHALYFHLSKISRQS